MTLSIRVSTPQGLVFCSDSLISLPNEVDTIVGGQFLNPGVIAPDAPHVIAEPVIVKENFIVDTKPNNNKIMQISDFPLAVSVAGYGAFLSSKTSYGNEISVTVPFHSYKKEVDEVISKAFGDRHTFINQISRCACFTLCCGAAAHTVHTSEDGRGYKWTLEILGGGYSTEDMSLTKTGSRWPFVFEMNVDYGGEHGEDPYTRWSTVQMRVSHNFLLSSFANLLLHFEGENWFEEFCNDDLEHCIKAGMENYYAYSQVYEQSLEDVINYQNSALYSMQTACSLLSRLIPRYGENWDSGYDSDGMHHLKFTDVVAEMWNLRESDSSDSEIELLIGEKFDTFLESNEDYLANLNSRYIEDEGGLRRRLAELEIDHAIRNPLIKEPTEEEWSQGGIEEIMLSRMEPERRELFPPGYISALHTLIRKYAFWALAGSALFIDDHPDSRLNTFNSHFDPIRQKVFGLKTAGQAEILERITEGMGSQTRNRIGWEIYQQNREALDQLGTLLYDRLGGGSETTQLNEDSVDFVSGFWKGKIEGEGLDYEGDMTINFTPASDLFDSVEEEDYVGMGTWGPCVVRAIITPDAGYTDYSGDVLLILTITSNDEPEKNPPIQLGFSGTMDGIGFTGSDDRGLSIRLYPIASSGSTTKMIVNEAVGEVLENLQEIDLRAEPWRVSWETLPLKTSVEISHYLMESTIKNQLFQGRIPTIGGEIKTVTITPDGVYKEDVSGAPGIT